MNWKLFAQILQQAAPIALNAIPQTQAVAGLITHAMTAAAQLPDEVDGATRKRVALNIVADAVDVTNAKAGRTILDKDETLVTADHGIETAYGVTKLLHDHAVAAGLKPTV